MRATRTPNNKNVAKAEYKATKRCRGVMKIEETVCLFVLSTVLIFVFKKTPVHSSDSWLLVAVVVVTLAVFLGYVWYTDSVSINNLKNAVESKSEEVNKLRDRVEELVEIKGRCEAQVKFNTEKDEAVKSTSLAHQTSTDKFMKMLDKAQELLASSRDSSVEKEEKCHKQLEKLRLQMNAVLSNVTELVKERHKYYHQSEMCYDKLEQCNTSVNEMKAMAVEWKRKYDRCWWC